MHSAGTPDEWDFFISHASEDKRLVAGPLAHYLQSVGFSVWYDDFTLRVGDSVLREIDRGLGSSRYGVVVLSEAFFAKQWPQRELAGLMATAGGDRRVLPVWHGMNVADVARYSPLLADVKGVSTARGLHVVAGKLVRAAFPERVGELPRADSPEERLTVVEAAREPLRAVLAAGGGCDDVRQVLTVHRRLLATVVYGSFVPPGRVIEGLPGDFVTIRRHGMTGPIEMTFVVLGPTGPGGADVLAEVDQAFGPEVEFHERPYNNYLPGRRAGEFPLVHALTEKLSKSLESRNIHHRRPGVWNFSVLFLHGRRGEQEDLSDLPTRVHVQLASYDRLLDNA
ncbi:hypothetical protein BBK82_09525 [Lentzea guizhouensis]|uniref:TIR domain-containing protein n=1 Tax=Lentzea guizhouensis TaxID=1586287 RepID=A0A1B2HEZ6_9PSEU|nr:toll/interleukin-1 receptor domain-containing protein [Lentzea guizhouensis]ANZ36267.1 hypothetical protein BBK82_09525 [Lentzea guizhouensis]